MLRKIVPVTVFCGAVAALLISRTLPELISSDDVFNRNEVDSSFKNIGHCKRGAEVTAALQPAKGQRVELGRAVLRYAAQCKAEGREPVPPDVFMDAMARFCKTVGIKAKIIGENLYLMDAQLVERGSTLSGAAS
jgi:hypothetical protein